METIERVTQQLKALADEGRMLLFLILWREECCVCELVAISGWDQSRISHQLKLLKLSGLVENRKEGKWVIYSVPDEIKSDQLFRAIYCRVKLPSELIDRIKLVKGLNVKEKGTEVLSGISDNSERR